MHLYGDKLVRLARTQRAVATTSARRALANNKLEAGDEVERQRHASPSARRARMRTSRTSRCPFAFATSKALCPLVLRASSLARQSSKARTEAKCPPATARMSGTSPPASCGASTSAPARTSAGITSAHPFMAAQTSGVSPSRSEASTSAPPSTSASTMSTCPETVAQISGVSPWPSGSSGQAPDASNRRNTSTCWCRMATTSGRSPLMSTASMRAPWNRSCRTVRMLPEATARPRAGLQPDRQFGWAPLRSKRQQSAPR
mmetsp:Transcript_109230/g.314589  ORF Transcript_109230/g.314589 Transcript_109230/m.314589 type:complete len:260 (+) Transcript_109230:539-1318(+)